MSTELSSFQKPEDVRTRCKDRPLDKVPSIAPRQLWRTHSMVSVGAAHVAKRDLCASLCVHTCFRRAWIVSPPVFLSCCLMQRRCARELKREDLSNVTASEMGALLSVQVVANCATKGHTFRGAWDVSSWDVEAIVRLLRPRTVSLTC